MQGLQRVQTRGVYFEEPIRGCPQIIFVVKQGLALLQGTYLPQKIGLDLEQMQQYEAVREMGKQVKNLYEKLRLQHDLLSNQNPGALSRQSEDNANMTRQLSSRIQSISSWKYAPAPLSSGRTQGGCFKASNFHDASSLSQC